MRPREATTHFLWSQRPFSKWNHQAGNSGHHRIGSKAITPHSTMMTSGSPSSLLMALRAQECLPPTQQFAYLRQQHFAPEEIFRHSHRHKNERFSRFWLPGLCSTEQPGKWWKAPASQPEPVAHPQHQSGTQPFYWDCVTTVPLYVR